MDKPPCPMCGATMRDLPRQIVEMEGKQRNATLVITGDVTTEGFLFCTKCTYARLVRGGKP